MGHVHIYIFANMDSRVQKTSDTTMFGETIGLKETNEIETE